MRHIFLLLPLLFSCVSITHYDDIKGTWHSSQASFGGFAEEIILDIGSESVIVTADGVHKGEGSYRMVRGQAIMGWAVNLRGYDIVFYDATLTTDDKLILRWKPIDFYYNFTSIFDRE